MNKRQKAVDWAVECLRDRYPEAKLQERSMRALGLAFPKGFISEYTLDGKLQLVLVVPDGDEHILMQLEEASSSQTSFDAVLAWASVKLLENRTIPNKKVSLFVSHYLIGNMSRPTSPGRPGKQLHESRHALLRYVVANLESRGFCATRNDESKHRNSACDIVAEAMVQLEFTPNTYRGIKSILLDGDRVHLSYGDYLTMHS